MIMNYDINCISMNMDIRKNPRGSLFFYFNCIILLFFYYSFVFFFVPILLFFYAQNKRGLKKELKDYFVSDSYLFNQWIGTYSGSELWGVLPDFFYQLKAPICILFILCRNALLENFHNLHY